MTKYKTIAPILGIGYLVISILWLIYQITDFEPFPIDFSCGYYECPIQNSTGIPIMDQINNVRP